MNRIHLLTGLFIGSFILVTGCDHCRDQAHDVNDPAGKTADLSSRDKPVPALPVTEAPADTFSLCDHPLGDSHAGEKKKIKAGRRTTPQQAFDQQTIQQRIDDIRRLKASGRAIDITSGREMLYARNEKESQLNQWLAEVNPNMFFCVEFENDIFTNTDRYYTNGIRFDLIDPGLNRSFLTKLMIPLNKPVRNYYGISFIHRMYTPWDPHLDTIEPGDRPFSAYMYFGFNKLSNVIGKRYRQLSAFNIGLIGSAAQGEIIQETVHFEDTDGWKYQIRNDIILDYYFRSEAGLVKGRSVEIGGWADAHAGTLYDNVSAGPYLLAGIYDPAYLDHIAQGKWGISNPASDKLQCFLFYRFRTTLVGYDATLQGGVFTKSDYTLGPDQINHFTYEHNVGLVAAYKWASFQAEYYWLSPEYEGCDHHQWGQCSLNFTF